MGTNFYWAGRTGSDEAEFHIGKRSAAGMYCWTCRATLCKEGDSGVHKSCGCPDKKDMLERIKCDRHWHEKCPVCGKAVEKEGIENNAAGRELGFNKNKPATKTGIKSCASFSWAMSPARFLELCIRKMAYPIEDEYGQKYSLKQFRQVLEECPIQFYDFGQEFF